MTITNKDVDKLKEVFATKEDLGRIATKEDLDKFTTKEDLKGFAVKIFDRFTEHDRKFEEIDNKFSSKFDEVLGGLDKVMGELEKAREDRVFAKSKDEKQDRRLDDLDERAQKVEAKIG